MEFSNRPTERDIEEFLCPLFDQMSLEEFSFEYELRIKTSSSLKLKMQRKKITFKEVHDYLGARIILDSSDEKDCYKVLKIAIALYGFKNNFFNDFIKEPKSNGYQSLHAVFKFNESYLIEFQIRTKKMHEVATTGTASHENYKLSQKY